MKLCFATNNVHKIAEVKAILDRAFQLITLQQAGIQHDLSETQDTLEGNARQKALFVFQHTGISSFADDTGLEVDALLGIPGVLSARYAGPQRNSNDNIRLLLKNLKGIQYRDARFRTVVSLISYRGEWLFEGIIKGSILESPRGNRGFGYDPVFLPVGSSKTLAEMSLEEKNRISHRAIAIDRMAHFLKTNETFLLLFAILHTLSI